MRKWIHSDPIFQSTYHSGEFAAAAAAAEAGTVTPFLFSLLRDVGRFRESVIRERGDARLF